MTMKFRSARGLWIAALCVSLTACGRIALAAHAQASASSLGATVTTWGGEHVRMQVTAKGATLDFDCASGEITKPVQADAFGNFTAVGTFIREHGGPVRNDAADNTAAAKYSGTISGDTMRLSITSGSDNAPVGEFVLSRGTTGHLVKCR